MNWMGFGEKECEEENQGKNALEQCKVKKVVVLRGEVTKIVACRLFYSNAARSKCSKTSIVCMWFDCSCVQAVVVGYDSDC